jgi:hypothetical protein
MMCCQTASASPASETPVAVNRASITAVSSCGTGSSDGAPRESGLAGESQGPAYRAAEAVGAHPEALRPSAPAARHSLSLPGGPGNQVPSNDPADHGPWRPDSRRTAPIRCAKRLLLERRPKAQICPFGAANIAVTPTAGKRVERTGLVQVFQARPIESAIEVPRVLRIGRLIAVIVNCSAREVPGMHDV